MTWHVTPVSNFLTSSERSRPGFSIAGWIFPPHLLVTEIDGWAPRSPQERAGVWQSPAERGLRKAGRVGHRRGCNRFTGYQASSMDFYYNVSDHLLAFHMCLNLTFFSSRLIGTLSVLDSSAFINACKKTEIAPIACRNMKDINTTECWKEMPPSS